MDFKIDENLPVDVARQFAQAGHDALTALEEGLGGEADQTIAEKCKAEGRILVTLDVGFADIRAYPPSDYPGFIVLRLQNQDRETVVSAIARLREAIEVEELSGRLWIVEEARIRVRE